MATSNLYAQTSTSWWEPHLKKEYGKAFAFLHCPFIPSADILQKKLDSHQSFSIYWLNNSSSNLRNSELPSEKTIGWNPSSIFPTIVKVLALASDVAIFHSGSEDLDQSLQIFSRFVIYSTLHSTTKKNGNLLFTSTTRLPILRSSGKPY